MSTWNPPIMTVEDDDESRLTAHIANLAGAEFTRMSRGARRGHPNNMPSMLWLFTYAESYFAYRGALA